MSYDPNSDNAMFGKIMTKLQEHDTRFDKLDTAFSGHDKRVTKLEHKHWYQLGFAGGISAAISWISHKLFP